jgi:hypothetical protein
VQTNGADAYGKTVWSWPSLLRSSLCGDVCEPNRADGIVNSRRRGRPEGRSAPGRSRHKPSTHCAGKAGRSAAPVCRCAAFLRVPRTADRGCQAGTRPFLRPFRLGRQGQSKARAMPAARTRRRVRDEGSELERDDSCSTLRHCEPTGPREARPDNKASRSNPDSLRGKSLDCFVAKRSSQ